MSSAMIKAHGGTKNIVSTQRKGGLILSHILSDTTMGMTKPVHMAALEGLISNTTGIPRDRPVMDGVLTSTIPAGMRDTPELMPVHSKDATASKMASGATFAGKKSGYGEGGKAKSKKAM